jgi:hypothetical protein
MEVANTLAYYNAAKITALKRFIVQAIKCKIAKYLPFCGQCYKTFNSRKI